MRTPEEVNGGGGEEGRGLSEAPLGPPTL